MLSLSRVSSERDVGDAEGSVDVGEHGTRDTALVCCDVLLRGYCELSGTSGEVIAGDISTEGSIVGGCCSVDRLLRLKLILQ